jgi:hypothetical protein
MIFVAKRCLYVRLGGHYMEIPIFLGFHISIMNAVSV